MAVYPFFNFSTTLYHPPWREKLAASHGAEQYHWKLNLPNFTRPAHQQRNTKRFLPSLYSFRCETGVAPSGQDLSAAHYQ